MPEEPAADTAVFGNGYSSKDRGLAAPWLSLACSFANKMQGVNNSDQASRCSDFGTTGADYIPPRAVVTNFPSPSFRH
jgi:hypothetical protein